MEEKSNDELKVLVLNGSPRKEKSSTFRITKKFLLGLEEARKCRTEIINIEDLNVTHCRGCLSCWGRTEGECVIKNDDIPAVKQKIIDADVIVLCFPLYIFGLPGGVKVFCDRMVSLLATYEGGSPVAGEPFHAKRYGHGGFIEGKKQDLFIISTCGYSQTDMIYDPLLSQINIAWGKENYYALLCPQGQSLSNPMLFDRIEGFLVRYVEAGKEFGSTGVLSPETLEKLKETPFNQRRYKLLMDLYWKTERSFNKNNGDGN